jgi:hypothetical protein
MKRPVSFLILCCLLSMLIGLGVANAGDNKVTVRIPTCQEDEIFLKGKGDFDGERWSRYVCIHPDNL